MCLVDGTRHELDTTAWKVEEIVEEIKFRSDCLAFILSYKGIDVDEDIEEQMKELKK